MYRLDNLSSSPIPDSHVILNSPDAIDYYFLLLIIDIINYIIF